MRQSNLYIVIYAGVLTIVCGGLLALASEGLKEKQQFNIDMEQKKNILSTVIAIEEGVDINQLYAKRVKAFVVDFQGNVKEAMQPKDVNLAAEYKKPREQRLLPVYEFKNETDSSKTDYAVLPVYGYGLWNNIWGFVALKSDLNTVQGVKFQHAGETPGLGARIESDEEVQNRYKGKTIFDQDKLVSVTMMKGEGNDYSKNQHRVDGMSGATLTGKGVNNMLLDYFQAYENYMKKNKKN
ncbi:MAG TPA: NADH:ubiquinone reductase (Na(+)-transporting) subunit C [Chryseolinea sp.]|nr:NADH:ubiquinone reductase (Na(+)-transporting) subunit C [Chryseolinea sp.]